MKNNVTFSENKIQNRILIIRGERVMIDADLAEIYGVNTSRLNEQVKRNLSRFPKDFMFQLTQLEWKNLMSHFAISSWGGRRKLPYVFTEHGAVMLASVLNSPIAVRASIQVVRAFVKLREVLNTHKELALKLQLLENKSDTHDKEIRVLFEAIKQLMQPPPNPPRKKVGFKIGNEE
jgi:hypothetical protein